VTACRQSSCGNRPQEPCPSAARTAGGQCRFRVPRVSFGRLDSREATHRLCHRTTGRKWWSRPHETANGGHGLALSANPRTEGAMALAERCPPCRVASPKDRRGHGFGRTMPTLSRRFWTPSARLVRSPHHAAQPKASHACHASALAPCSQGTPRGIGRVDSGCPATAIRSHTRASIIAHHCAAGGVTSGARCCKWLPKSTHELDDAATGHTTAAPPVPSSMPSRS